MSSAGRDPALDDGLTCYVCLDSYTEGERRPLMLPACGHTFCRQCLAGIVTKERSNFLCPACRRPQPVHAVQDLPVNYSLLDVIRRNAVVSPASSLSRLPQQETCSEHEARLAFWCLTCEVAVCGECLFERHPSVDHDVVRIQEQMATLQEMVKIRSSRVVTQLVEVAEENITEVKLAFLSLVEHLRQRRAIDKLMREARQARTCAKGAEDLTSVTAVHQVILDVQREFEKAQITTPTRVTLANPMCKSSNGSQSNGFKTSATSRAPEDAKTAFLEDPHQTTPEATDRPASQVLDTSIHLPTPMIMPSANTKSKLKLDLKPDLPAKPVFGTQATVMPVSEASSSPYHTTSPVSTPATSPAPTPPGFPSTPTKSARQTQQSSKTQSTQTAGPWLRRPGEAVEWESGVCGVLSGSWTSSKVTLEPRGLHVYCLKPMKEKCDLFLNLSVVSAAIPLESPVVFLDLEDDSQVLGRVYITLQIHFRRAQQFFSLCLGDRGPSYVGSYFHSVLRRGDSGEGLAGGDYEGKAGKGGAAIMEGIEGQQEVAKRCEKGMVVRASSRVETAAQFCISVKDGPRFKTVFPFGRVCQGLAVVEAACRRPAFSVSVSDCGLVLPL